MKTAFTSLFLVIILIFSSCCATKTTTDNTSSTTVETPTVSENPTTTESVEIIDGWSTKIDNVRTTQIKMICEESKLEIRQKILAYLRLNRIHLSDTELQSAIVETSESGRIIIPQNNYSLDFSYKNNEVIVRGEEKNAMGIDTDWEPITPFSSNWSLLSGFSNQLTIKKVLYD